MRLPFDNSYARDLPGLYVSWKPASPPEPRLLYLNTALAQELGLPAEALSGDAAAALWSGRTVPEGAEPLAQAYAGHQFGGFSPQLGDGRALLLGELIDTRGQRRDIAFKGSGRTPFSRGGDGKAAVGPMLREVLIGEAMHALGIPTTRALAVAATGEPVIRENVLPGAVLTRVAASHLRVGTFQYFASRGEYDRLRQLADYAIARHDPALASEPDAAHRVLGLLRGVGQRQAALIAQWMNVGFIHGVMNTDNMTISGETIDYGPCAFMEAYDPDTVFSSIDRGGRYAYANQPHIARWNLARLAEALLPLLCDREDEASVQQAVAQVTEVIDAFPGWSDAALLRGRRAKLGLQHATPADDAGDTALINDWLSLLQAQAVDHTLGWRSLGDAAGGDETALRALQGCNTGATDAWLTRWRARLTQDDASGADPSQRPAAMRRANPAVIPRNHRVEEALAAATEGDMAPFERLLAALQQPFDASAEVQRYLEPAPASVTDGYRTFCGT